MDAGNVIFKFIGDDKGLKSTMNGLAGVGKTALAGLVAGTTAVASGFTALVTASVKARGEMEQLEGGAKKIFDQMDFAQIEKDAHDAYKSMNLSASEYLDMMNKVGATFAQTMGDQKGYDTAKKGLQAISDYASGTGADINLLNDKYKMITRSTSSYLSIADQFAGILPQTTKDFLAQAQASGYLSKEYKKLTDVPVAEYQEAVTNMIEKGVDAMGLLGNTTAESTKTLTGSIAMTKKAWANFLSGKGSLGEVVESFGTMTEQILVKVNEAMPQITEQITKYMPMIIETGGKLVGAIVQGVMQNLPQLMSTAGTIISDLLVAFSDNIDEILDVGIEVIFQIIDGITQALPDLIPKVIDVIIAINEALMEPENMAKMLECGVKLVMAIGKGIINSIPNVIEAIFRMNTKIGDTLDNAWEFFKQKGKEILKQIAIGIVVQLYEIGKTTNQIKAKLKEGLDNIINSAKQWGRDFLNGFAQGIQERLGALRSHVESVANAIRSRLHFSRPDVGPLRDYETWMPDMIKGMAKSLDHASPMLLDKISALSSEMAMNMSPSLNGSYSTSMNPTINVAVHNTFETDPLGQMVNNVKTFSNGAKNDYNYGYGG